MKQTLQVLGKTLSKEQQRSIKGGLPFGCYCITVSQAGPCWHIYWNKPCGTPGHYVICDEGPCPGCENDPDCLGDPVFPD